LGPPQTHQWAWGATAVTCTEFFIGLTYSEPWCRKLLVSTSLPQTDTLSQFVQAAIGKLLPLNWGHVIVSLEAKPFFCVLWAAISTWRWFNFFDESRCRFSSTVNLLVQKDNPS
jgi:hypothetical protein